MYGALAVLITAVYVAIAVGIGALAGGGGKPNLGLSILATAVVAVGFQPVRARLNKLGNRLVYGRRFTPYEVLSDFSAHAAGSFAYADALPRMAQVLSDGVGAESAVVWLRSGGELRVAAVHPPAHAAESALPIASDTMPDVPDATLAAAVRHQGELLGAISIVKRRGEPLTPIEEKLVHDLAQQAGLMFKNVGLTAALEARLEDLRASRQRLVTAQDRLRLSRADIPDVHVVPTPGGQELAVGTPAQSARNDGLGQRQCHFAAVKVVDLDPREIGADDRQPAATGIEGEGVVSGPGSKFLLFLA